MTEYPAKPIDYDSRVRDPASWHSVGLTLWFAADILWRRLHPALKAWESETTLTDEQELALRLRGPFAMLAGMAIEDMIKSAIVEATPTDERTAPPQHHDLLKLSKTASLDWDLQQTELLQRLTTFVLWAGRYPVATSAKKSQAPRILKDTDYLAIARVAEHLQKLHMGHFR